MAMCSSSIPSVAQGPGSALFPQRTLPSPPAAWPYQGLWQESVGERSHQNEAPMSV